MRSFLNKSVHTSHMSEIMRVDSRRGDVVYEHLQMYETNEEDKMLPKLPGHAYHVYMPL